MIEKVIQLSNASPGVPVKILTCSVHVSNEVSPGQAHDLLAERVAFDLGELPAPVKIHAVQLCDPEHDEDLVSGKAITIYTVIVAIS